MTPQEQAEFVQLQAQASRASQPPAAMTPEEQEEFRMLTSGATEPAVPQEYTTEQAVGDVGKASQQGFRNVLEDVADIATQPFKGVERHQKGLEQWRKNSGISAPLGYLGEMFDLTGDTAMGRVTEKAAQGDPMEYNIPEGQGPDWLEPLKSGSRFATEAVLTAPVGGMKYMASALKAAAGGAGGAAAGQYVGGDTGEVVGALTGAFAANPKETWDLIKGVGSIAKIPIDWARKFANRNNVNLSNATDEQLRGMLEDVFATLKPDDPDADLAQYWIDTERRLTNAGDELGTMGQITKDKGLLNMEASYAKEKGLSELGDINTRINSSVNRSLDEVAPGGDIAEAAILPRSYAANQQKKLLDAGTKRADVVSAAGQRPLRKARAQQAPVEEALSTQPRLDEVSPRLAETTKAVQRAEKAAFTDRYDALRGDVPLAEVRAKMNAFFESIGDPALAEQFKDEFKGTFRKLKKLEKLGPTASIRAFRNVQSEMAAEKFASSFDKKFVGGVDQVFDDVLENLPEVGQDIKKLNADYSDFKTRYKPIESRLKAPEGSFANPVVSPRATGQSNINVLKKATQGNQGVQDLTEEALRAQFKQAAQSEATDALSQSAITRFKNTYGSQLDQFPKLKTEVDNALATTTALDDATVREVAMTKRSDALRKESEKAAKAVKDTPPAQFSSVGDLPDDLTKQFGKVMKLGTDRTKNLTALVDSVEGNAQGLENLKRTAMEDFVNSVTTSEKTGDVGMLTNDAVKEFRKRKKAFLDSGLFDEKVLQNVDDALTESQKLYLHPKSGVMVKLPVEKRRLVEALTAITGAKIGAFAFGSPLIGAALGRKAFVGILDEMTTEQARKLAYEMSVNPGQFKGILERVAKNTSSTEQATEALKQMLSVTARTSYAVDEDE